MLFYLPIALPLLKNFTDTIVTITKKVWNRNMIYAIKGELNMYEEILEIRKMLPGNKIGVVKARRKD